MFFGASPVENVSCPQEVLTKTVPDLMLVTVPLTFMCVPGSELAEVSAAAGVANNAAYSAIHITPSSLRMTILLFLVIFIRSHAWQNLACMSPLAHDGMPALCQLANETFGTIRFDNKAFYKDRMEGGRRGWPESPQRTTTTDAICYSHISSGRSTRLMCASGFVALAA
jgi:hypothetical protein